jgi:hypothetical protein
VLCYFEWKINIGCIIYAFQIVALGWQPDQLLAVGVAGTGSALDGAADIGATTNNAETNICDIAHALTADN